jgi:hypothetical protein
MWIPTAAIVSETEQPPDSQKAIVAGRCFFRSYAKSRNILRGGQRTTAGAYSADSFCPTAFLNFDISNP